MPRMVERRALFVFCPMLRRAAALEDCLQCPRCMGLDAAEASRRPTVRCSFKGACVDATDPPVASVLSRHSSCVRVDAVTEVGHVYGCKGAVAVVDDRVRLVGLLDDESEVRSDDAWLAIAVEEHTSIADALRRMAGVHLRSVPVVARDGTVVGVVDDLDAMRALRQGA